VAAGWLGPAAQLPVVEVPAQGFVREQAAQAAQAPPFAGAQEVEKPAR
jgi:hypothetical protein